MKTSELSGAALDWAVAEAQGLSPGPYGAYVPCAGEAHFSEPFHPSTDWSHGGPIIESEEIELHVIPAGRDPANWVGALDTDTWAANICVPDADYVRMCGPTPLIAAMRCLVASKFGDTIDIPEELCA